MPQMSYYLDGQLRAHLFRTASYTKPTNLYISLHTTSPLPDGSGAEANYGSYARVLNAPLDANWTPGTGADGITTNAGVLSFPACTSGSNTVTYFGVWDALTTGNLICFGALTGSTVVSTGVTPAFAIGALSIAFQ